MILRTLKNIFLHSQNTMVLKNQAVLYNEGFEIDFKNEMLTLTPKLDVAQKDIIFNLYEFYDNEKDGDKDKDEKNEYQSMVSHQKLKVILPQGLQLKHYFIYRRKGKIPQTFFDTEIEQSRGSRYSAVLLYSLHPSTDNAKLESSFKSNLRVALLEEEANCELYGLFIHEHPERITLNMTMEHFGSRTQSEICMRGVLKENAKVNFQGTIRVYPSADHTQANLENRNLLLSPLAEIKTQPILEIHQKEVNCKHGATVGALDEEALFYLQSRGLSRMEAKQIMVQAFLEPILSKIRDTSLREHCQALFCETT